MLTLAKEVENADRERLEQAVIKAESPVTSLSWVTSFDTKRFNEHLDIIVDIGTFSQCYSMYSQFYDCLAPYKKELLLFALHAKAQSPFELIQLSKVNQDDRIK